MYLQNYKTETKGSHNKNMKNEDINILSKKYTKKVAMFIKHFYIYLYKEILLKRNLILF